MGRLIGDQVNKWAGVAKKILNLDVIERPVPIEEVLDDGEEMFCTGTAYTVQPVRELVHDGGTPTFNSSPIQAPQWT